MNPDTRVRELTDEEVKRISEVIDEGYMVEGDLRREVAMNIKYLSYPTGKINPTFPKHKSLFWYQQVIPQAPSLAKIHLY